MKSLISHMRMLMCWGVLLLLLSCQQEVLLLPEGHGVQGVDWGQQVEVTLPFDMGKAVSSTMVTKTASKDEDSQLAGIMVFVYEAKSTTDLSQNKRVAWHLFTNPQISGVYSSESGEWIPDGTGKNCGRLKFYVPTGDVYIYLIGNALNSYLEFFPTQGGEDYLATQQDFLNNATPKWKGAITSVDGYLPMVGKVNNATGLCKIEHTTGDEVVVSYEKDDGTKVTIQPDVNPHTNEDYSFILKRLMCKVSVKIKSGTGVSFTPKEYRFCHVAKEVPPAVSVWSEKRKDSIRVQDSEIYPFSTQMPDTFTVYLPENVRKYTGGKQLTFADRDRVYKDAVTGENVLEKVTDNPISFYPGSEMNHKGHYRFENAPAGTTYLVLYGSFEDKKNNTSAETRYIIHLGDFSKGDFTNFSLERDYHYNYTITVNGVNDILAEVTTQNENTPGAEGVVFKGGARVSLDAHYEQVEMKVTDVSKGVYVFCTTPFGRVNGRYFAKGTTEGGATGKFVLPNYGGIKDMAEIKNQLEWIKFRKQTKRGELAAYHPTQVIDVFEMLDQFHDLYSKGTQDAYYTCFVNEYYYDKKPDGSPVRLEEFVNEEDRVFAVASDLQYSPDKKSAVANAIYVLQQRSIACFYDLTVAGDAVSKYGVESKDETGKLYYGASRMEGKDDKTGRANTILEVGNNWDAVDWKRNGYLLQSDGSLKWDSLACLKQRVAHLACLTRNRDLNGNGTLDADEIRWYNPARDQLLGLWIGEPGLPREVALFTGKTSSLSPKSSGMCYYPVYSSTGGNGRVIWAEQGCTFGDSLATGKVRGGHIRAVRNLGDEHISKALSHTDQADPYYAYDPVNRTIEVYLSQASLRGFSYRELEPHNERSEVNRPYRKFQVAKDLYVKEGVVPICGVNQGTGNPYVQLQTTTPERAMMDVETIAKSYPGSGETAISEAKWRLPNQREMALMVVALPKDAFDRKVLEGHQVGDMKCVRESWAHGFGHKFEEIYRRGLHCRTSFSNPEYTEQSGWGYVFNTLEQKIQMMHVVHDEKKLFGGMIYTMNTGSQGIAGYLCVRDVLVP